MSICQAVGDKGAENCTSGTGTDAAQKAAFIEDENGICAELGDYNSMAAQVVAEGNHHVLHVRYNYSYAGLNEVDISFTTGTDTAPNPMLTQADGVYSVSWAGLTSEPPLPAPPPPPRPPPPPPPPTQTYTCQ